MLADSAPHPPAGPVREDADSFPGGTQRAAGDGRAMLPVGITPYYMSLLSRDDPNQPLRRTVIPYRRPSSCAARARPTIRWAKTATARCRAWSTAIRTACCCWCSTSARRYCRYCTRSRVVGHGEIAAQRGAAGEGVRLHPQHAGHPRRADFRRRSAGPERRAAGLDSDAVCGQIPHVEFVRIGTKMPAVLPQRITPELCRDAAASTIRCG